MNSEYPSERTSTTIIPSSLQLGPKKNLANRKKHLRRSNEREKKKKWETFQMQLFTERPDEMAEKKNWRATSRKSGIRKSPHLHYRLQV